MVIKDWANRSVLITGHSGFKGSWLSLWLHSLGARVHGYALNPPTQPSLFEITGIAEAIASDIHADILDLAALRQAIVATQSEVIFHLAAQPLVRESYLDPLGTFATNVMGTANLLEAIRGLECVSAVVIVTTDKVYDNREWMYPYREVDPLGGRDPYSASKAAAEIVVASYRESFFMPTTGATVKIATARAGNVIGGGDWAKDRLIPDCLRAFARGEPVRLRYPQAVRPWQHVLEPIAGYVRLAEKLLGVDADRYCCAWNFGPDSSGDATVGDVARLTADLWGDDAQIELANIEERPHEAGLLRLDITRARSKLGWQPRWSVQQALQATVDWHRAWLTDDRDMQAYTLHQIRNFQLAPVSCAEVIQ
jgi:CDP-glucose 4,6-dehydratase